MTVGQMAPACAGHPLDLWFPVRHRGGDNHGRTAKSICRGCPIRVDCLTGAVARNEQHGIWGGAGEADRRVLRRAWRVGGPAWLTALGAHFDRLDGVDAPVPLSHGAGATHGRRVTYARGCRCPECSLAAVLDDDTMARLGGAA